MSKLPRPTLERLVRELILPFYQIERLQPAGTEPGHRYETDAEHSWLLALFACALAPHVDPTLDVGKICQFAVVHDLVEVYAGDIPNFAPDEVKAAKDELEQAALYKIQAEFKTFPWIAETVTAYEGQTSAESRFVKSADKILPLIIDCIQEGLCYKENKVTRERWQLLLQKHREKAAAHATAFEYYDELWNYLLAHPEFFYQET